MKAKKRGYSLQDIHDICDKLNIKCLSNLEVRSTTQLLFECDKGHQWSCRYRSILNTQTPCPECRQINKLPQEKLDLLSLRLKEMGGECLSEITRLTKRISWKCKYGHVWQTTPRKIISGTWCPRCAGNVKLSIKDAQDLASKKGGKCLSKHYKNAITKMTWECKEKHQWETSYNMIQSGKWCPYCAKVRVTLEMVQEAVSKYGGICLSKEYINHQEKVTFLCEHNHRFEYNFHQIRTGSWCPECKFLNIKKVYFKHETNLDRDKNLLCDLKGRPLFGILKSYHSGSKQIKFYTEYKNGLRHGKYFKYFQNGNVLIKGRYKNGSRSGFWYTYNVKGDLVSKDKYPKIYKKRRNID